jgi:hypothetical protein
VENVMRRLIILSYVMFLGLVASASPVWAQTGVNLKFTTIDYPGAAATVVNGINRHGTVGQFVDVVGGYIDITGPHGFVLSGGHYTTIDVPNGIDTEAFGINNLSQIVGTYYKRPCREAATCEKQGFVYFAGTFTSTPCTFPYHFGLVSYGINDAGSIAGNYLNTTFDNYMGAFYDTSSHPPSCKTITTPAFNPAPLPAAFWSGMYGLSNPNATPSQLVVGHYISGQQGPMHGLLFQPGDLRNPGVYETLDIDAGSNFDTWPRAVNNVDQIVGSWGRLHQSAFQEDPINESSLASGEWMEVHGFLYSRQKHGFTIKQIDYPGAQQTEVKGINNPNPLTGQYSIVGLYLDVNNREHGFVASPQLIAHP